MKVGFETRLVNRLPLLRPMSADLSSLSPHARFHELFQFQQTLMRKRQCTASQNFQSGHGGIATRASDKQPRGSINRLNVERQDRQRRLREIDDEATHAAQSLEGS